MRGRASFGRTDTPRYGLSRAQVREFFASYGNRCLACGAEGVPLVIDHVKSRRKGGVNHPGNFQPLCRPCNSQKRSDTIDYRERVADLTAKPARAKLDKQAQRVTVDLPPDLYERLRAASYQRRDSMNKICIECLEKCLPPSPATAGTVHETGERYAADQRASASGSSTGRAADAGE